jgi:hypothetical protein
VKKGYEAPSFAPFARLYAWWSYFSYARLHSNTLLLGSISVLRPASLDFLMKRLEQIVLSIEVIGQSLQRTGRGVQ